MTDASTRRRDLRALVSAIVGADDLARRHLADALDWIDSGAPLWRISPPDRPPKHLVAYFVITDPATDRMLLVDHRKAGLLLPPGGHVEPDEDPWQAVVRECAEELRVEARSPSHQPAFLTVTRTTGGTPHTDVSLWYLLQATEKDICWYDEGEFAGIHWLSPAEIRAVPITDLDPHMHRFLDAIEPKVANGSKISSSGKSSGT